MHKPFHKSLSVLFSLLLLITFTLPVYAEETETNANSTTTDPISISQEASGPESDASSSSSETSTDTSGVSSSSITSHSQDSSSSSTYTASSNANSKSGSTSQNSTAGTSLSSSGNTSSILEEEPLLEAAALQTFALSDEIIIDSSLLTPTTGIRMDLDLNKLKIDQIFEGTLVIEGSASKQIFVNIIDTNITQQGNYNIVIGDYAGIEIPAETGVLNTFGTITNKPGISNMLPIYVCTNVDSIIIGNNGTNTINLLPKIDFKIPYSPNASTHTTVPRYLGIVVNGESASANTVSLTDITVSNYNQSYNSGYVYPTFIGAQNSASIDNLTIGNVSIQYGEAQMGALIGAALMGKINHFHVVGNVNFTGTILSGGVPNANYSPQTIIGSSQSYINQFIIASTAKVVVTNATSYSYGTQIGFYQYSQTDVSNALIAEHGSEIIFNNFANKGSESVLLGGDGNYFEYAGKVDISVRGNTNTFIGKGYNSRATTEMLLIKDTADIKINSKNYVSVAIGYGANVTYKEFNNLIIEKGAKIDLAIETPYSIRNYYTVDNAIGGSSYHSPTNLLIGATKNPQTGAYEVVPSQDNSKQTEIHLKNYRMLTFGGGANSGSNFNYNPIINANVYAEYNTDKMEFFGGSSRVILVGGSYLAHETKTDTLSYISFTEKRTGSYNSLNSIGKNKYDEKLEQMLYNDAEETPAFTFTIPSEGFNGAKPTYDYIAPISWNSTVSPATKSIYYPIRKLIPRLNNPAPNGEIHVNGVVEIEFDQPVFAADHLEKNKVITIHQNGVDYLINLNNADKSKYTFGSELPDGNPKILYIHLSELTNSGGQHLQPNQMVYLTIPAETFQSYFYMDNPQLKSTRSNDQYFASFAVTEAVYNVQFDLNGAPGTPPLTQTVLKDAQATMPSDPEWDEHSFNGWQILENGQYQDWDFTNSVTSDITLVALWKVHTYTVTYLGNGNTGGTVPQDNTNYTKDQTVTISNKLPTKTGYNFSGWKASFDNQTYQPGTTFPMPNKNVQLTAQWSFLPPATFTITYNGNGHSGGVVPSDANRYLQGATVTVSSSVPTKNNYVFSGWQTNFDQNTYLAGSKFTAPNKNMVLTALWVEAPKPTFVVTYDFADGRAPVTFTLNQGQPIPTIADPIRSGYSFQGWYHNDIKWNFTTMMMPENNITLLARWNPVVPSSSSASSSTVPPSSSSLPVTSTQPTSSTSASTPSSSTIITSSRAVVSSVPVSQSQVSSPSASISTIAPTSATNNTPTSATGGQSQNSTNQEVFNPVNATPAELEIERNNVRERLIDSGVPTITMGDTQIPLFGSGEKFTWSLVSLLFAIASTLTSVLLLVLWFINRKHLQSENKTAKTKQLFKILAIAAGILSCILFLLISNLTGVMVLLNAQSILFILFFVVQLTLGFLSKYKTEAPLNN